MRPAAFPKQSQRERRNRLFSAMSIELLESARRETAALYLTLGENAGRDVCTSKSNDSIDCFPAAMPTSQFNSLYVVAESWQLAHYSGSGLGVRAAIDRAAKI